MASFTDNIPQFNPYVAQLPVEAMVKVGMEKQQRYDQGIQKIQNNIDQIGGLSVIRDVDKAYLQSKINQMGNSLKGFMASDFSDFQLTNTVAGMTNQVVKDNKVLSAVASTEFYRKQREQIDKDLAEGKTSPANVYDFDEQAQGWLGSDRVGENFNYRYKPYRDVKKKAMDAIKALHPKLAQIDIPYEKNADGSLNTRAIADAMVRHKVEGIDEMQIKGAIMASLDAGDMEQLNIDGKYQFRGVTSEALVDRAKREYDIQRAETINNLQRANDKKAISSNPDEISSLDAQIEVYQRQLGMDGKMGSLDEQFYFNVENARNNPNAVKASIYKDGFYREFANAFSWKNETKELMTNPLRQQANWRAEFAFDNAKEQRRAFESDRNYNLDVKKFELSAMEAALKKAELYGDPMETGWDAEGTPTDNKLRAEELFNDNVENVNGRIVDNFKILNQKGFTNDQIEAAVSKWEKAQGNPKKANLDPDLIKGVMQISRDRNEKQSLVKLRQNLKKEAEQQFKFADKLNDIFNNTSNFKVNVNGVEIVLTPKEALDIYKPTVSSGAKSKDDFFKGKKVAYDTSGFNSKQLAVFNHLQNNSNQRAGFLQQTIKLANQTNDLVKEKNKLYLEKLSKVATDLVPQLKAVPKDKDGKLPPNALNNLSKFITIRNTQGIEADSEYDIDVITKMLENENIKDTDIFIRNQGGKYEILVKNKKLGAEGIQKLSVNERDIVSIFRNDGYLNKTADISRRVSIGSGNTNYTGNPEEAKFQRRFGDFPNVKNLGITADLVQDSYDPEAFYYSIHIKKTDGNYATFKLAGESGLDRVGYEQGANALKSLNDANILARIQKEYPNYDLSKLDL